MSKPELTLKVLCILVCAINLLIYALNPFNGLKAYLIALPLVIVMALIRRLLGAIRKALWG